MGLGSGSANGALTESTLKLLHTTCLLCVTVCEQTRKRLLSKAAVCFNVCWQNDYMKDFNLTIETWHKNDMGEEENVSPGLLILYIL